MPVTQQLDPTDRFKTARLSNAVHEGISNFRAAAESYEKAGSLKEALQRYCTIPDFPATLELVKQLSDHPATESFGMNRKIVKFDRRAARQVQQGFDAGREETAARTARTEFGSDATQTGYREEVAHPQRDTGMTTITMGQPPMRCRALNWGDLTLVQVSLE
jgi:hypothetical protein